MGLALGPHLVAAEPWRDHTNTVAAARPNAGGQVVTTSDDTSGDGTIDQRSIFTTDFD